MPHADSSLVPSGLSKSQFWEHLHGQVVSLLEGQTSWVSNLSNVSSIVYHSLMAYEKFSMTDTGPVVNWCGFYLDSCLFPPNSKLPTDATEDGPKTLLLGPFCGKPACQFIRVKEGGGVCADGYHFRETLVVPDVDAYPGHIACDGDTRSEIVLPMKLPGNSGDIILGVMDLDSVVLAAFADEDAKGLQRIVDTTVAMSKW
ncbi:SubName: Full=Uncharacterized protein {ECO:0000313/EMBL:CCA66809.1} [Serendipita indica DSM 11827]|uniref:GAF domain-containing protein n=1 Tax=Serendipita indica (strain DSM 11827) TaxID=1109443 RepID=G4T6A1_SERID|nr:SubName: Full=Uncharacterized protein {ECO:0000313/EMBL:CCA66809.1} [Serendipita indica DSM 11827]CCA66809.1 hypothetical protein PIIN_00572 [Serendipita indica DSM 11827]